MDDSPTGWWVTPYHFGIDQGPVVLMIENYRTGLIWDLMRRCPYRRRGAAAGRLHRRLAVAGPSDPESGSSSFDAFPLLEGLAS